MRLQVESRSTLSSALHSELCIHSRSLARKQNLSGKQGSVARLTYLVWHRSAVHGMRGLLFARPHRSHWHLTVRYFPTLFTVRRDER